MNEIHFTKKDFEIQWFSGTGGGGQYRNKHQNCCRIIHKETGLKAQGTAHRERPANQKDAFKRLASILVAYYAAPRPGRRVTAEKIRTYHAVRNEVLDKASGLKMTYKEVVDGRNIGPMIEARKETME
jgi:protein subunit release factor A